MVSEDELGALQDIERAAGQCFHEVGMPAIAEDEPLPAEALSVYQRAGRAWAAVDGADQPVAYLIADLVDGCVHIEQVSVHPDHARRGVGRALVDYAAARAWTEGAPALTLTTFTEVPWNAPYYRRCGFRVLGEGELTPGLRAIREREAAHGLDRWPGYACAVTCEPPPRCRTANQDLSCQVEAQFYVCASMSPWRTAMAAPGMRFRRATSTSRSASSGRNVASTRLTRLFQQAGAGTDGTAVHVGFA